jgi:aryl-alcohol dehydrogenase-like predicted oxidoreductase
MRYKLLGNSGLRVSELCLGTMTFGTDWGSGADEATSAQLYVQYRAAGGNFFDTAVNYTNGSSERILGKLIATERHEVVLATKYTLATRPGDPNAAGNHRKNLHQSLERSLRTLGTDYLDLLWVHAWDFTVQPQELMRTLNSLVASGKVLHIAISDTPAWVVAQCNTLAQAMGWAPFTALQIEYSLIERTPERELLPMAEAFGLPITAWSPLGAGILSGKYSRGQTPQSGVRLSAASVKLNNPRNFDIAEAVAHWAGQLGASPAAVALAWLRQRPMAPLILPILGVRNPQQLTDNLSCLTVDLPAEALAALETVSAVDLGFPSAFMQLPNVRNLVYSDVHSKIDF